MTETLSSSSVSGTYSLFSEAINDLLVAPMTETSCLTFESEASRLSLVLFVFQERQLSESSSSDEDK